jgi:hypothetical protein
MPKHVHLLVAFPDDDALLKQCESCKRFTATAINKLIGGTGRFWQQDGFDHLVRSERQSAVLRRYLLENPFKARLKAGEFLNFSKEVKAPQWGMLVHKVCDCCCVTTLGE